MPYSPVPTPPGVTSDSMMLSSGTAPPNAVNESCEAFTAPVDVPVVLTANRALAGHAEPDLLALHVGPGGHRAHLGLDWDSKCQANSTNTSHREAITIAST